MTQLASKKTTLFIRYFNYRSNQYSNLQNTNISSYPLKKMRRELLKNQSVHSFLQICSSGRGFPRQGAGVFWRQGRAGVFLTPLEAELYAHIQVGDNSLHFAGELNDMTLMTIQWEQPDLVVAQQQHSSNLINFIKQHKQSLLASRLWTMKEGLTFF